MTVWLHTSHDSDFVSMSDLTRGALQATGTSHPKRVMDSLVRRMEQDGILEPLKRHTRRQGR